jgi:hypothetical protein
VGRPSNTQPLLFDEYLIIITTQKIGIMYLQFKLKVATPITIKIVSKIDYHK